MRRSRSSNWWCRRKRTNKMRATARVAPTKSSGKVSAESVGRGDLTPPYDIARVIWKCRRGRPPDVPPMGNGMRAVGDAGPYGEYGER